MPVLSGEEERTGKEPSFCLQNFTSADAGSTVGSSFFHVNIADVLCFTIWYCFYFEVCKVGVWECHDLHSSGLKGLKGAQP